MILKFDLGFGPRAKRDNGRHVEEMTLQLHEQSQDWIPSMDWAAFASVAISFPQLRGLVVEVAYRSEQSAAYTQYAHRPLESRMRERGVELKLNA